MHDIMHHISGYKYFVKLYNLMKNYTFELDEES